MAPDRGRVFLNGTDITDIPMYERARQGISYLPQEPSVFRKLTVKENVKAILEFLDISEVEKEDRLREQLEELGVLHLSDVKAYALSGGERRRVER
jgi:lipopolysaccharide export system ATP-binding protein